MVRAVMGEDCPLLGVGVRQTKCAWKPGGFFCGPGRTLRGMLLSFLPSPSVLSDLAVAPK